MVGLDGLLPHKEHFLDGGNRVCINRKPGKNVHVGHVRFGSRHIHAGKCPVRVPCAPMLADIGQSYFDL